MEKDFLYNQLTTEDRRLIENYIDEYMDNEFDTVRCVPLSDLLKCWDANKRDMYKLLGNNLMIHQSVRFNKDKEEIKDEIFKELSVNFQGANFTFYKNFNVWFTKTFPNEYYDSNEFKYVYNLNGIVDTQEECRAIRDLLSSENLINNRYSGKEVRMHMPSGHDYSFTNGTKLFKILKKITDEFNIAGFEEYRLKHSQILNEKTIKGEMYLSIHPLDFMTMSDNDNGWHSCMSWRNDGDYRRGTVEMMNSPVIVEAFIPSTVDMKIPKGKWNNKRWRQLFIVDKDIILAIKGYPYWNKELEKFVIDWIKELAETNLGWEYQEQLYTYDATTHCFVDQNNPFKESPASFRFETNTMYNDIYGAHISYLGVDAPKNNVINYSGESICLSCGIIEPCFEHESKLVCENCEPVCYCEKCGERIHANEVVKVNGQIYCSYCAEELPVCDICFETITDEQAIEFYLRDADTGALYDDISIVCEDCFEDEKYFKGDLSRATILEDSFGVWRYKTPINYINIQDLTEEGKKVLAVDYILEQGNHWRFSRYTLGNGYVYVDWQKRVDLDEPQPLYDLEHLVLELEVCEHPDKGTSTIEVKNSNYSITVPRSEDYSSCVLQILQQIYPDAPEEELRTFDNYTIHIDKKASFRAIINEVFNVAANSNALWEGYSDEIYKQAYKYFI